MDEGIDILKLPPHTTDRLQPLDVVCFKSVKAKWDKNLHKWTAQHKAKRVSKSDFLGLVGEVWGECFKEDLIKKAFDKCGIYPFNRDRYPISAFAPHLLDAYRSDRLDLHQVNDFLFVVGS